MGWLRNLLMPQPLSPEAIDMTAIKALWPTVVIATVGLLLSLIHPLFLLMYVFGLLDFNGRLRDYRYLSEHKYINARLALFYGRSYCGRATVGALWPVYKKLYYAEGYRWWMVFPDNFPRILLERQFWRTLFLGHVYGKRR